MISVHHLHKRYGRIEAVRGVSFDVVAGEIFGLLGPNGAGKTTIIECIIGLREPDAGEIHVAGVDRRRAPAAARSRIGAALQSTALQDRLTPREALALFGALYDVPVQPAELAARFGLVETADRPFETLSGGERQRLALALAFLNAPDVVVLDEPTAGLDPAARRELQEEISRMKQDGRTVLMATHYLTEAQTLCDRVAVIDRGRIAAIGPPRSLTAASRTAPRVVIETREPLDRAALGALEGVSDVAIDGCRAEFHAARVERALGALVALVEAGGNGLVSLDVRSATLEDIFVELTAAGGH